MIQQDFEIMLIAVFASFAAAVPGVFLILRKLSLMSDAISHAILLGIVLVFFYTGETSSPLQIIGAAFTGLVLVFLSQFLWKTRLVKTETAIGLVFPLMFSVGVLLIALYADQIHLDLDAVILGEIIYAPFDRFDFGSFSLPKALITSVVLSVLNLSYVFLFYKELKLSTFDSSLCLFLGFSPNLINYGLMSILSVTAVSTFNAVGSILVVALFVVPPCISTFFSKRLSTQILLSCFFGLLCSVMGYFFALWLDLSVAGSIATVMGGVFLVCFLFHPKQGLLKKKFTKFEMDLIKDMRLVLVHISQHQRKIHEQSFCKIEHLYKNFSWEEKKILRVVEKALEEKLISKNHLGYLTLTEEGEVVVREESFGISKKQT